jgi:hypothetical protein
MNTRKAPTVIWVTLLWLLVLFVCIRGLNAQQPYAGAHFSPDCYTPLDGDLYRFYYLYYADGVDTFDITDSEPITTAQGWHYQAGHIDGGASITVLFVSQTVESESQEVRFNVGMMRECVDSVGVPTPDITPTPTIEAVDTCPAWSVDGDKGGMLCLWELPRVGEWQ